MSSDELIEYEKRLAENGYTKINSAYLSDDYYWRKGFAHRKNRYGKEQAQYLILITIYDWRKYGKEAYGDNQKGEIRANAVVVVNNIPHRVDLEFNGQMVADIRKLEETAASFFAWAQENFKQQ